MENDSYKGVDRDKETGIIRLGGLAVLLAITIHIIVNWVIKTMPPADLTAAELQSYFDEQADSWAIVHGLRYVAFTCIALFSAGLFVKTSYRGESRSIGWGVLGLLGTAIGVTNGIMTNALETLSYLNIDLLNRNQELFWLLRNITRTLFTAEFVAWAIVIFGFSMAGRHSSTIPKWLVFLGFLIAATGILVGLFIADILANGQATIFLTVSSLGGMVWFTSVGVLMLLRGAK
jgi:hypothetical protein